MARNRDGFTFIELLVVVIILGILASIALPRFAATKDKAKLAALRSDVGSSKLAEESYYADHGSYATFAQLQADALITLSPGSAIALTATASGYNVRVTDGSISSAVNTCSVLAGVGVPPSIDGVISCP
jgi:prepilin-type N-terminal cleavage/methylation domain-containing protein